MERVGKAAEQHGTGAEIKAVVAAEQADDGCPAPLTSRGHEGVAFGFFRSSRRAATWRSDVVRRTAAGTC
jgi:hypothetical protein